MNPRIFRIRLKRKYVSKLNELYFLENLCKRIEFPLLVRLHASKPFYAPWIHQEVFMEFHHASSDPRLNFLDNQQLFGWSLKAL